VRRALTFTCASPQMRSPSVSRSRRRLLAVLAGGQGPGRKPGRPPSAKVIRPIFVAHTILRHHVPHEVGGAVEVRSGPPVETSPKTISSGGRRQEDAQRLNSSDRVHRYRVLGRDAAAYSPTPRSLARRRDLRDRVGPRQELRPPPRCPASCVATISRSFAPITGSSSARRPPGRWPRRSRLSPDRLLALGAQQEGGSFTSSPGPPPRSERLGGRSRPRSTPGQPSPPLDVDPEDASRPFRSGLSTRTWRPKTRAGSRPGRRSPAVVPHDDMPCWSEPSISTRSW